MSRFVYGEVPVQQAWRTPVEVVGFARSVLQSYWGLDPGFDLDAAALKDHSYGTDYLGPDHVVAEQRDAISVDWASYGDVIWVNPPYGLPRAPLITWVHKAIEAAGNGAFVALLVPNTTDTEWFGCASDHCTQLLLSDYRIEFLDPQTGKYPVRWNKHATKWQKSGPGGGNALFFFAPGSLCSGAGHFSFFSREDCLQACVDLRLNVPDYTPDFPAEAP